MNGILALVVGVQMVEKMEEARTMERFMLATSSEQKVAIVQETERFVLEIADEVFKPEEVIGAEGVEAKNEFVEGLIAHNYRYFNLPNPFDYGVTLDEVKKRHGVKC
jgi:hypothetical protein